MQKVLDFFHEKYKTLIPIMVLVVLLITVFFLWKEYKYDNYRNKKEYDVYQYFGGEKIDYTAQITYNLKDSIVDLKPISEKIEYDSTPVYFKDSKKILFPSEMNIVFPLRNGSQYKLFKYSTYYMEDDLHYINNNSTEGFNYNYFFLYDGSSLFFFPDSVSLYINGKEYTTLSSLSYVKVVGGYTLIYYDYEKDESKVIELNKDIVTVTSKNINVNLNEKYCLSFNEKVLLFNPNKLNPVFKTN